jgi:hypothetical protein
VKGLKYLIIAAIAIVVACYGYSPYQTVHAMKTAGENRDGEALAEHIDFPSVRQSLKEQVNVKLEKMVNDDSAENPIGALGAALGGMLVDKLVDAYVTPAGLIQMMKGDTPEDVVADGITSDVTGRDGTTQNKQKPFQNASYSYESLNTFAATVKDDKSGDEISFILTRSGFANWKLTEIQLPMNEHP